MSDKELLELAAKAIGKTIKYNYLGSQSAHDPWYPLDDDGDALRLAVHLGLFVDTYSPATTVGNVVCPTSLASKTRMEEHNGDPYAATRRAIVRAAAAIGKAMP